MARVAVVLGPDYEDSEYEVPVTTLAEHGHDVEVVGTEKGADLRGKRGDSKAVVELAASDADPSGYDALVVPGGYSPDKLRTDDDVVGFVRDLAARDVPVAAICHAGSLLIEADLVRERRVTSWPSIRTDLVNAGAQWVDDEVVVDGNLITSRKPDDLPAFCDALLERLA
jgi:protease I